MGSINTSRSVMAVAIAVVAVSCGTSASRGNASSPAVAPVTVTVTTAAAPAPSVPTTPPVAATTGAAVIPAPTPNPTGASPASVAAPSSTLSPPATGWIEIARARSVGSVAAWTGHEVLVSAGGCCAELGDPDLSAFDPTSQQWRSVARSGLSRRNGVNGVWTGTALIEVGGHGLPAGTVTDAATCEGETDRCAALTDGAAYDPATDRWTPIAPMPASIENGVTAWTGTEMLVWRLAGEPLGFAYSPATDSWRQLSTLGASARIQPSTVWTGDELVVWGGMEGGDPVRLDGGTMASDGVAYSPAADAWRPIAAAPVPGRRDAAAVWTGSRMLVWGGSSARDHPVGQGAAYDPATDSWQPLPLSMLKAATGATAVWTGSTMVVVGGSAAEYGNDPIAQAAAYDPASQAWHPLPQSPPRRFDELNNGLPLTLRSGAVGLWTGTQVLVLGGRTPNLNAADPGGFLYTPTV